jgi:hypothetical protein
MSSAHAAAYTTGMLDMRATLDEPDPIRDSGRRGRIRLATGPLLVAGLAILSIPAAEARPMEPRLGLAECDGGGGKKVPGCYSLTTLKKYNVQAGRMRNIRFQCRGGTPYFWNWHADMTRGMQVTLRSVIKNRKGQDSGGVFELREQGAQVTGAAQIYLGCSASKPKITSRLHSLSLDPLDVR